jgi:hypothetical protein
MDWVSSRVRGAPCHRKESRDRNPRRDVALRGVGKPYASSRPVFQQVLGRVSAIGFLAIESILL